MRNTLWAIFLVSCLAGCGKSSPPTEYVDDTTIDNSKTSEDPRFIRGKPVEHWIAELRSPDEEAASRAGGFLAQAGAPAVPGLIEALKDPSEKVRTKAAITLGRIGAQAANTDIVVKGLVESLKIEAIAPQALPILVRLETAAVP